MDARVMVMAGGTGGHVFPALAVAEELRRRGAEVFWLGTPNSFESKLVPERGFAGEWIEIKGLRGSGLGRWLSLPYRLARAMLQAAQVLRRRRPGLVLGMGGFVAGPGGIMARLFGIPLVIHEQNAIPGLTNSWLARVATRVLEAFPGSFPRQRKARATGNPVRQEIARMIEPMARMKSRAEGRLNLLVLGGSQGAQAINHALPEALALFPSDRRPLVRHQAGDGKAETTQELYQAAGIKASVTPFIDDMAEAYGWADLVICRAGALTIAELAAAGVAALVIPFPHAVDDHQTHNARYLTRVGAAVLMPQSELNGETLFGQLQQLLGDRSRLLDMADRARRLALPDAAETVADVCEEVVGL